jgi:pyruvate/oxaloacetate carboxyltransferase
MKTYALPVHLIMEQLNDFIGLDLTSIYVVDSAGCMLPSQVSEYVKGLTGHGWDVGFHGHNNLQLANANCLSALESGARYIDGTLSGMGRSAGNAQTEVLSWLIKKENYSTNVDVDTFALFDIIDKYLKTLMPFTQGNEIIDLVIGMSKFHSGYFPLFKRVLSKYDINIYQLIQKVSEIDCVNPSEALIDSIAKDLSRTDG